MNFSERNDDPLIEQLADEFAQRCRKGERPQVAEYEQRYPEIATQLRALLSTVEMMERSAAEQELNVRAASGTTSFPQMPPIEQLGDYKVLREIGRGGMGVVFEAVQQSLGRRVAVKVLGGGPLANERSRRRFLREARAAAALHHSGIVPVFGVGQQDGLVYYVMPLISGRSLEQSLGELGSQSAHRVSLPCDGNPAAERHEPAATSPSAAIPEYATGEYCQWVARWGAQVADALAHAHAHGITHRDIKPGNILISGDGTPRVTDFGVARSTRDEEGFTQSGDVVGTTRYMAPEQVTGGGDWRSDIFALGLTMFEALSVRQADHRRGSQPSSKPVGRGSPGRADMPKFVPSDLAKIVIKATEQAPEHRYGSAKELSEDLHRYLDGRPILARRVSVARRLSYWSRRNPATASLAGLVAASLLLSAVIGWIGYASSARALAEAQNANERSDQNMQLALEAFDSVLASLVDQRALVAETDVEEWEAFPPEVPSRTDLRVARDLLRFYERYANQRADDRRLRVEMARAHRRIGELYETLGKYAEARTAYRTAIGGFESVRREEEPLRVEGSQTREIPELAAALNGLGRVLRRDRRREEGVAHHRQALRVLKDDRSHGGTLARLEAHTAIATVLLERQGGRGRSNRNREELDEAEQLLHAALELVTRTQHQISNDHAYALYVARCHQLLCTALFMSGSPRAAAGHYQVALRQLQQQCEDYPGVAAYRRRLVELMAASVMVPMPRSEKARWLVEGEALARQLCDSYPHVPDYRMLLVRVLTRHVGLCERRGELTQAADYVAQAVAASRQLNDDYPNVASFQYQLSYRLELLSRIQQKRGDETGSVAALGEAIRLLEQQVTGNPDAEPAAVRRLAGQYQTLSELQLELGDDETAGRLQRRATELASSLANDV